MSTKTLHINVTDCVATYRQRDGDIVCGNNVRYEIEFTFDGEWSAHSAKIARFVWNGEYFDVAITSNKCTVPAINRASKVEVGVYVEGGLCTTTSATIPCVPSILCRSDAANPGFGQNYTAEAKAAAASAKASEERVVALVEQYGGFTATRTVTTDERSAEVFRRTTPIGTSVFDTTLSKPFWMGALMRWYDATGTTTDAPLVDIVNFGDSIFGKYQDNTSISAKLATLTGKSVMNAGLGGTSLVSTAGGWGQFALEKVVDAIYADVEGNDNKAAWNSLIKQAGGIIAADGSVTHPTSNVFIDGVTLGILTLEGENKGKVKNPQTGEYYDTNTVYFDLDNQTLTRNGVTTENAVTQKDGVITAVTKTIDIPSYFSQTFTNLRSLDFSTVKHITFNQGTNDFSRKISIEDYKNTAESVISKLKQVCPDAEITIIGIINRFDDRTNPENDATTLTNGDGVLLTAFMDAQEEIAADESVNYIDLFTPLLDKFNKATVKQYYTDSVHPNASGNTIISEYLANTGIFGNVVVTPPDSGSSGDGGNTPTNPNLVTVTFVINNAHCGETTITDAYVYSATMTKDGDGNDVTNGATYEVGRDNVGEMPKGTYRLILKADGYNDYTWAACAVTKTEGTQTKTLNGPGFSQASSGSGSSGDSGDTPTDTDLFDVKIYTTMKDSVTEEVIEDAHVEYATRVADKDGNALTDTTEYTFEVGTDDDGVIYSYGKVRVGKYKLSVVADGYREAKPDVTFVSDSASQRVKTLTGYKMTKLN